MLHSKCSSLTPSIRCEFRLIIQLVREDFWVVFTHQLDSKLNNAKITVKWVKKTKILGL